MVSDFFTGYGNKLSFSDDEDMKRKLSEINFKVSRAYTGTERERYYILNYIPLLFENNLIKLPLDVECIDTGETANMPDFRITNIENDFVLETTMATTEEFIRQKNEFDRAGIEWSYHVWMENGYPRVTVYERPEKDYSSPSFGKSSEIICGILTSDDIIKKTKKLPKYNIEKELQKELLVYYNFPTYGNLEIDYALKYIYRDLVIKNYCELPTKFDKIHFMWDKLTVYDILSNGSNILHNRNYYYY